MRDEGANQGRLITRPFLAVTAATFAFFSYVGMLVPIIPTFVEDELRGGELGIGLSIASFSGAAIVVRPLIGRMIDQHGRRTVMIAGALLAATVGVVYGFIDSLPLLLVLRSLSGIGEAALFVGAATLVADLSPDHRRAEAASYFSVAVYAGLGVGPVLGETLMANAGLRPAFALAAGFAALAAALSIAVPSRVAPSAVQPVQAAVGPVGIPSAVTARVRTIRPRLEIDLDQTRRRPFVHRDALGPGAVLAIGMSAFVVFTAFLPDYSRALGLSGSGGLFAVYSGVCLVIRVVGAKIPERLGPRTSVTFAFAMLGCGLAILTVVAEPWALWAAAGFVGFGMAFMYPSLMALTVNRAPEHERARAIGSFTMFFEAGTAAGGLAFGALADMLGKRVGFGGAAMLCVVGVWVLWAKVVPGPATRSAPVRTLTRSGRRDVVVEAHPATAAASLRPVCGD